MSSYRECPSCRALLTDLQLSTARGTCPYCGGELTQGAGTEASNPPQADLENPYAPPKSSFPGLARPRTVAQDLGGKIRAAFRLLFGQLPLFAAIVLTIWIPGQLLVELAMTGDPNHVDPWAMLRLVFLVEVVFGPICAGAIITALAEQMSDQTTSYAAAMRAGLHHWGRLFGARIVAGLIVLLGLLALITPGIILAIRFSLVDEVVVLEGAGVSAYRRSTQLTWGRGLAIFLAWAFSIMANLLLAIALVLILSLAGLLNNPLAALVSDALIRVFSVFFTCLLFLFYWEARQQEPDVKPIDS
jgi:hypothetical protein